MEPYWNYEREWRYILPAAPQAREVPIKSITTGCNCTTDLIHLLKEIADARGIKIYQMSRATREGFASLIQLDITKVDKRRIRGFDKQIGPRREDAKTPEIKPAQQSPDR
jgi:hypothetical protein